MIFGLMSRLSTEDSEGVTSHLVIMMGGPMCAQQSISLALMGGGSSVAISSINMIGGPLYVMGVHVIRQA